MMYPSYTIEKLYALHKEQCSDSQLSKRAIHSQTKNISETQNDYFQKYFGMSSNDLVEEMLIDIQLMEARASDNKM